jgi:hypothetical protein
MVKLRWLLLSALAVLIVGAATASSASAAFELTKEPCANSGKPTLCWDSKEKGTELRELKGEEAVQVTQLGSGLLEVNIEGTIFHIECTATKLKEGVVHQTEPLVTLTTITAQAVVFTGCKMVSPANCEVLAELPTEPVTGDASTVGDIVFEPTAGTTFIKISVKGVKCPVKLTLVVEGKAEGLWAANIEEDLKGHELKFVHKDTGLIVNGFPATLEVSLDVNMAVLEATDFWDLTLA